MIDTLSAPEHVVAVKLRGKIGHQDFESIERMLDERLVHHQRVGLLLDARELEGVSWPALVAQLRYAIAKLGEYHRFARIAVVSDRRWLHNLSRTGDAVPATKLRAFGAGEVEAARAWLAELPAERRRPGLRLIATNRSDTFAFAWNGTISQHEMAEALQSLQRILDQHERIRVLARIEHLGMIAPGAFTGTPLFALKRRARDKAQRYAVVGGPRWLASWVKRVAKVSHVEMRHVPASEEASAWAWIDAQPAERTPSTAALPMASA